MGIIFSLLLGCLAGFCAGSWGGILGQLATAIIGAVVILWIASFFKK